MRRSIGGIMALALVTGGIYGVSVLWQKAEMERIITRLTGETRVASAIVLDQVERDENGDVNVYTTVRFIAKDKEGQTLAPQVFTVSGDMVYFEALVIKFEHDYVKRGDALRGKSLHLFRRAFGEKQAPSEGFELEGPSQQASQLELDLWKDFWDYANSPDRAAEQGVRIVQGEAVAMKMMPKKVYHLSVDHAGGLNIKAEEWPPEIPWPPVSE